MDEASLALDEGNDLAGTTWRQGRRVPDLWCEIERSALEAAAREPSLKRQLAKTVLTPATPPGIVGAVLERCIVCGRDDAATEAEGRFRRALDLARDQGARSLELRAATSLAGLWAEQGERRRAHAMLAAVFGWFSEGFDMADLKDAAALLDQLA